jgi:hypothetical protein
MKNRALPRHCDLFFKVARDARLTHPLGRALYACNRIQNGGGPYSSLVYSIIHPNVPGMPSDPPTEEAIKWLSKIKGTTAVRWAKHWKSGGSIKSLSHGKSGRIRSKSYAGHSGSLKLPCW